MAITPAVATALGGTTTTTSFTITIPSTVNDGDLLTVWFTHRGTGNGTVTDNSGVGSWTRKGGQIFNTSFSLQCYYKRVTNQAAERGATITGASLTNSCAGVMIADRGVISQGDPFEVFTGEDNASANETHAAITVSDGALVGLAVGNSPDLAVASQAATSPATLTERAEVLSTGGTDSSISVASALKSGAGSTGSLTWAQTDAASGSLAFAIKAEPSTAIPDDGNEGWGVLSRALGIALAIATTAANVSLAQQSQAVANQPQDEIKEVILTGGGSQQQTPVLLPRTRDGVDVSYVYGTEDFVSPAVPVFDEGEWTPPFVVPLVVQTAVIQYEDDLPITPVPPIFDEGEWVAPFVVPSVVSTIIVQYEDPLPPIILVGGGGQAPIVFGPRQGPPDVQYLYGTDDVIVPQPAPLTISEDYWLQIPPIVPPPNTSVEQTQDEIVPVAVAAPAYEDYWLQLPVVIDTSSVSMPVPWAFGGSDGGISGIAYEEYHWTRPTVISPVVSHLTPFSTDDITQQPTAIVTEDYWFQPLLPAASPLVVVPQVFDTSNDFVFVAVTNPFYFHRFVLSRRGR